MKIGGTGLIGSKTVAILRERGHEVVAGSPKSGVNRITGEGLKEAMAGSQVVIDLANSASFEDRAVLEFFETSGRNQWHKRSKGTGSEPKAQPAPSRARGDEGVSPSYSRHGAGRLADVA
jgi:hypothetical protein